MIIDQNATLICMHSDIATRLRGFSHVGPNTIPESNAFASFELVIEEYFTTCKKL